MSNLEEADRKDLILRRKGEARYLRTQKKKLQKGKLCRQDKTKRSS